MSAMPPEIGTEIARQTAKWGDSNANLPDDRWLEIATDEFNDLRWAVRTGNEVPGHTIAKERAQLIAVLIRWAAAVPSRGDTPQDLASVSVIGAAPLRRPAAEGRSSYDPTPPPAGDDEPDDDL